MAIKYGSQYVDERYSPIVEPNLYAESILIPGTTYTDKYQIGPAGQIAVHKLDSNAVTPVAPGSDFNDEAAKDDLITINLNNCFQKSRKIYNVQANAVEFNIGEEYLADSVKAVRDGRQDSALACLAYEATDSSASGATASAVLLGMRKEVRDAHARPTFALCSTTKYAALLSELGLKESDDSAIRSAELIRRFGMAIIECDGFDNATAKYRDNSGTEVTVDLTNIDFIVGDAEAFSVIDNVNMVRLVDSENFNGTKAQVEINTGFKVTNPSAIVVKATSGSV